MSRFNLSALAVKERAVTLFLILALSVAGIYAFFHLGRAEDPTFTEMTLTMTAMWPGATAQEMQDQVAEPLEKRLQELTWYDRAETFTRPGVAFTVLTLQGSTPPKAVVDEFYQARKKLADEAPKLPRGVVGPFVNDEYSDVTFALYALKAKGEPLRQLARDAESLRQRLLHVPGVRKVNILGEQAERIYLEFSPTRLATLGISTREILAALAAQNLVTPAGSVETRGPRLFVRLDGALDSLDTIRAIPISAQGRTLRLADVAEVKRGYEDPANFVIRNRGEPTLLLSIVKRDQWNGLDLGKALDAEVSAISKGLPLGLSLTKVSDQTVNIDEAVGEFMIKFFVALAVVLGVCLISMGWRVGIVVAAAVPLTLAFVFVIMLSTGREFDRVSLGALILALGLLVDDAIIAIEMMVVKMEEGYDRITASAYAWSHTAALMLSGTLLTVIGLMPVGFAKSVTSEYAGDIFWVVGFALIASWIVAVVFTPYLGVKLLPEVERVEGGHDALYNTPRYNRLRRILAVVVRRKWGVAGAVIAVFVLAVFGMGAVSQQFFPESDRPELLIDVQTPDGSSIGLTDAAVAQVEAWLRRQPEAHEVTSYIGQGPPRFYLPMAPELPDPAFAKIVVLTPDAKARDSLKLRLRRAVADGLAPQARVRASQLFFGPNLPYLVAFRVSGPDADRLRAIAQDVSRIMQDNPHMRGVNSDWGAKVPTLRFVLDQNRLRALGLTSQEVAEQLQMLLTGTAVTQVREDIRTVDVIARAAGQERLDPSRFGGFILVGAQGQRVPVEQVGRTIVQMEDPILRRRDRVPTITVRGDLSDDIQPPEASAQIDKALAPLRAKLPPGYSIDMGGVVEESGKSSAALAAVFPVMLVLMLLVIMLQVRSFSVMLMVIATAPLGLVGVVPMLLAVGKPFGFTAIIGLIGLAGILMRNTLILTQQIHDNQAAGLDPYNAVIEATVQRSRPVILTALAAVLAFIPLTFSLFWGGLAYTLIGGTLAGTVLTLVFLPALYAIFSRIDGKDPPTAYHATQR
ncbi:efflux RND transporter permease subunit [Xanthomonas euvesicatoria]|uniref:efflux RND transporter permease subunit n=1 Tax=Xanthomonas euvesicatoria TaxID=456327 RepID=UPI0030C80893